MDQKWVIFIMLTWILLSLICLMCEGAWLGSDEGTLVNSLMDCKLFSSEGGTWGRIIGLFDPDLYVGLLKAMTFDYDIFYGMWQLVRWIVFMPIAIAGVFTLAMSAMRLIRGSG